MSELADYADHDVVAGMIDVLWAGAHLDALTDLHDLLGAIGVLRPDAVAPRVAIAWWHVRARAWDDALAELARTEQEGEFPSLGSALMAVCLYARGDPAWRAYAQAAVRAGDDPTALRTAQALLDAPEIARARGGAPRRHLRLVQGAG
jgi:type III secretion protein HrpB1